MPTPSQIVAQERIRRAARVAPGVVKRIVAGARAEGAPVEEAARRAAIAVGAGVIRGPWPTPGAGQGQNPAASPAAQSKTNWLFWIAIAGGGYWLWRKQQDDQRTAELAHRREERTLVASLTPEPRMSAGSRQRRHTRHTKKGWR